MWRWLCVVDPGFKALHSASGLCHSTARPLLIPLLQNPREGCIIIRIECRHKCWGWQPHHEVRSRYSNTRIATLTDAGVVTMLGIAYEIAKFQHLSNLLPVSSCSISLIALGSSIGRADVSGNERGSTKLGRCLEVVARGAFTGPPHLPLPFERCNSMPSQIHH
jgi:hypothetical protein